MCEKSENKTVLIVNGQSFIPLEVAPYVQRMPSQWTFVWCPVMGLLLGYVHVVMGMHV